MKVLPRDYHVMRALEANNSFINKIKGIKIVRRDKE